MGKKGGKKQNIAYSKAKYDFQVPKINSLAVKTIFYINESTKRIFWTIVRLNWPSMTKKEPKRDKNGSKNIKSYILKPNMSSKCPKFTVWWYKSFLT